MLSQLWCLCLFVGGAYVSQPKDVSSSDGASNQPAASWSSSDSLNDSSLKKQSSSVERRGKRSTRWVLPLAK